MAYYVTEPLGTARLLLEINARLFRNALSGMTGREAELRPNGLTNHIAFLACHLVEARFFLLEMLGGRAVNPFAQLLAGASGIEDVEEFPPLEEVLVTWVELDEVLRRRLDGLSDDDLDAPCTQSFPVEDRTLLGAISFLVQHDSYHVGQLCFVRKYLGHPAVAYGVP